MGGSGLGVSGNVPPMSMPSTSLSLTLRSTFLMLSFSPVLFTAVVPKARGTCTAAVLGRTLGIVLMTPDIMSFAPFATRTKRWKIKKTEEKLMFQRWIGYS